VRFLQLIDVYTLADSAQRFRKSVQK